MKKSKLKEHNLLVHDFSQFVCKYGEAFVENICNLLVDVKSSFLNYSADCGRKFLTESKLLRHQATHSM